MIYILVALLVIALILYKVGDKKKPANGGSSQQGGSYVEDKHREGKPGDSHKEEQFK